MARKRFIRGGKSVRSTMWIRLTETSTNLAAGNSAAILLSLNAAALALRPFTIVRTRGVFQVTSDQTAATERQAVALGMCIVSDQASAIGVTAVPTPYTDAGSDLFFVYEQNVQELTVVTAIGFYAENPGQHYDSKAMRKVNDDQDFIVVIENSGVTSGADVFHSGRMLIKLH